MTYAILSPASWPSRRTSTDLSSPDHHALQVKLVAVGACGTGAIRMLHYLTPRDIRTE